MGNQNSSENAGVNVSSSEERDTTLDTPSAHTPRRARSSSASRRIVKVSRPQSGSLTKDDALAIEVPDDDDDDQDDDDEKMPGYLSPSSKHTLPKVVAEMPAIARELDQEHVEEWRKERMQSREERQRMRREQAQQERRNKSANGNSHNKDSNISRPEANPFSRFLRVFSVEPKYPEHKRSYEGDTDFEEPVEKRLRPACSTDEDEKNPDNEATADSKSPSAVVSRGVVAAAVAVAAFAVIVAFRLKKTH